MERWQAEGLAQSMCQSFPRSQIAPDIWTSEIEPLDLARAEETVRQLRRTADHAPSIAQFFAKYHGLLGSTNSGNIDPDCAGCHDTGWITCLHHPQHHGHFDGREDQRSPDPEPGDDRCECGVVCPCVCKAGKARWGHDRNRSAA